MHFIELDRDELRKLCNIPPDSIDGFPRSCKQINIRDFAVEYEQGDCYYASLYEWELAPDLQLSIAVLLAFTCPDVAVLHDGETYVVLVKK
jgi:hypothetical protein